jgi:hypothetical protein
MKNKTDNPMLDITVDELKLFTALELWFDTIEEEYKTNKNFWARNKIAELMKQRLKKMNKWKDGLRSPRKQRDCDFKKRPQEEIPPELDF